MPVKQRDHVPRRDGADDEGRAGPGNQGGARFRAAERVVVVQEVAEDGFGGCSDYVDSGVVAVRNGVRVDLIGDHDGGYLAGL